MCGRFILLSSARELVEEFDLEEAPELVPRYNIAPSQEIAAITASPERGPHCRELTYLKWGLIPFWAKDPSIAHKLINARAETLDSKPAFKSSFRKRRILIPANGFFEWKKTVTGPKQPYLIGREEHVLFAFAGISDEWKNPSGEIVRTCAIITTDSNDLIKSIHDRMPVIVLKTDYALWLESKNTDSEDFRKMLESHDIENLVITQVSPKVNKPDYDEPDCIEPVENFDSLADLYTQGSLNLTE
ncbi:MAG: SOS response-associated peptidase [Deltaproteobacteria bacterium]|nr:SOS response-associated peptidase [Deltaproteobacteria bacterium]